MFDDQSSLVRRKSISSIREEIKVTHLYKCTHNDFSLSTQQGRNCFFLCFFLLDTTNKAVFLSWAQTKKQLVGNKRKTRSRDFWMRWVLFSVLCLRVSTVNEPQPKSYGRKKELMPTVVSILPWDPSSQVFCV
jgi:hypothetical protein